MGASLFEERSHGNRGRRGGRGGRFPDVGRQVPDGDCFTFRDKIDRPFYDMFQFPDIAGPVVIAKQVHHVGRDGVDLFVEEETVFVEKMANQFFQIPHPFPEWRYTDDQDTQTVEQVITKAPLSAA